MCVWVCVFILNDKTMHSFKLKRVFGRTKQLKNVFFSEPKKKIRLFLTAALFNKASELCYRQTREKTLQALSPPQFSHHQIYLQANNTYRVPFYAQLPGGEARREPQLQPESSGESHLTCHHQNGGGTLLLVRLSWFSSTSWSSIWTTFFSSSLCSGQRSGTFHNVGGLQHEHGYLTLMI